MNGLTTTESSPLTAAPDLQQRALVLAAEAVLAHLTGRAPLRLVNVNLTRVEYALSPDVVALRGNRGLLEDVVIAALAGQAAARMLQLSAPLPLPQRDPRALLDAALTEPEEQESAEAYLSVLEARARALLRRSWAEVQVVAAGLQEQGELDATAVGHRIACAQSIRGTLLN